MSRDRPPDRDRSSDRRIEYEVDRTGESPTPGEVFGVLANDRQRFVLYLLEYRGGTVSIDELAGALAAWNDEAAPPGLASTRPDDVLTHLYHVDLPGLSGSDLVAYDRQDGAVTLTREVDALGPFLEFSKELEPAAVDSFLQSLPDR